MANTKTFRGLDEDSALRIIMEGTASETGENFFKALVENLAKVLNIKGAWVTEYKKENRQLNSLAFWLGGKWVDEYNYDIAGTPCESVVEDKELIHIAENLVELYPDDPDLEPFGAVSYIGVPLLDLNGCVLGHLAVFDTKPLPEESWVNSVFNIFAARASAELQRIRAEYDVREREEKLSRLVDSAMDAIVELNNMLEVTMMNSAAEKVFGIKIDLLKGNSFLNLLCDESANKFPSLIQDLGSQAEGKRYLWISGGLQAQKSDGTVFPADATISQYEISKRRHYTIILRNINEHLEAKNKIKLLSDETSYLREEIQELSNFGEIVGDSEPLKRVFDDINQISKTDSTVLILGETGTGKELVARAIHSTGRRGDKPLIRINCGAIPASLIESELFGHEKGAFTGATSKRDGRFKLADKGTIFLDEVGELPLDLQTKLLRVLQEGEFEPVGSSETMKVDVRVIAATNVDLLKAAEEGRFRTDLYYRLNVFPITVPPLKERGDDIVKLAEVFSGKVSERIGVSVKPLNEEQKISLLNHDWPGNVRELQNVIELAVITSKNDILNLERALPTTISKKVDSKTQNSEQTLQTIEELQEMERDNIIRALTKTNWRIYGEKGAAKLLGTPPTTLSSKMKSLGIRKPK
jgi:PAS domain S-box-containing protein